MVDICMDLIAPSASGARLEVPSCGGHEDPWVREACTQSLLAILGASASSEVMEHSRRLSLREPLIPAYGENPLVRLAGAFCEYWLVQGGQRGMQH
ncbi:hypothetical protein HDU93_007382, partial [Gonapodya sp. JEL0774]